MEAENSEDAAPSSNIPTERRENGEDAGLAHRLPQGQPQRTTAVGYGDGDLARTSASNLFTPETRSGEEIGETRPSPDAMVIDDTQAEEKPLRQRSTDWTLLSSEIWQHIFTFSAPQTLGKLLTVNRMFFRILNSFDGRTLAINANSPSCILPDLDSDAIWRASRRNFWPRMPAPLDGCSEIQMWRLICSSRCDTCSRKLSRVTQPRDVWSCGPGANGIATVFSFTTISCGECLVKETMKEVDVLLSPSIPSLVLPALPFMFLSNGLHAISPSALQDRQFPLDLQFSKVFSSRQIRAIETEFDSAKGLGLATAEEWLKGLADRGKNRRNDAARWDKWALAGGFSAMLPLGETSAPPQTYLETRHEDVQGEQHNKPQSSKHARIPGPPSYNLAAPVVRQLHVQPTLPEPVPRRQGRTKEEATELRARRRADIERRALLLDPPLSAEILTHMPSFRAAVQITADLDDEAWGLLKPRLLSQHIDAKKRQSQINLRANDSEHGAKLSKNLSSDTKGPSQQEWDDVQGPLRAKISKYADELVEHGWGGGRKVTSDTCSQFAASVLVHVRQMFYADVAKAAAIAKAARRKPLVDPKTGPFTQKLTLENMKWIFDLKIKPRTERFRKELFVCNGGCSTLKLFGFEAVIQHYAAKHTSTLSVGSVVVYWKAEWPEVPPFHPNPSSSTQVGATRSSLNQQPPHQGALSHPIQRTSTPNPGSTPQTNRSLMNYPYGPHYQHSHGHRPGFSSFPLNFDQAMVDLTSSPTLPNPPQQTAYRPDQKVPGANMTTTSARAPGQPSASASQVPTSQYIPNGGHFSDNTTAGNGASNFAPTHVYSIQMGDMARNTREIWNRISTVKELPGSLRVFVILHHVSKRHEAKFATKLPLEMFIDGLSNNKGMRPVRNVNQLMCGLCFRNSQIVGKKSFSLPQLVNHYKNEHARMGTNPNHDWISGMILLPEHGYIPVLAESLAATGHEFRLVADAIPWAVKLEASAISQSMPTTRRKKRRIDGPSQDEKLSHGPTSLGMKDTKNGEGYFPSAQQTSQSIEAIQDPPITIPERGGISYHRANVGARGPNVRPPSSIYIEEDEYGVIRDSRANMRTGPTVRAVEREEVEASTEHSRSGQRLVATEVDMHRGVLSSIHFPDVIVKDDHSPLELSSHGPWQRSHPNEDRETQFHSPRGHVVITPQSAVASTTKYHIINASLARELEPNYPVKHPGISARGLPPRPPGTSGTKVGDSQLNPDSVTDQAYSEDFSLMAALESDLEAEGRSLKDLGSSRLQRASIAQEQYDGRDGRRSRDNREFSHNAVRIQGRETRGRSRSPDDGRHAPAYVQQTFRQRSPLSLAEKLHYGQRPRLVGIDDAEYAQGPQPEAQEPGRNRVLVEGARPLNANHHPKYEIVRIQDSHGEYLIRRPIWQEPNRRYAVLIEEPLGSGRMEIGGTSDQPRCDPPFARWKETRDGWYDASASQSVFLTEDHGRRSSPASLPPAGDAGAYH